VCPVEMEWGREREREKTFLSLLAPPIVVIFIESYKAK
jgi:hypothetical protein